ncbi:MAG TPA: MBOAT family protein [Planctomycetes bacterium]|nr:MBOAT family protein [Planctomycetota bacterium]
MLFTEPRFVLFFAVVFAVHWALESNAARKLWLLATSYTFYGAWDWRFLGLIVASTLVDYVVALRLERQGAARRAWLALSLTVNLGLLGVFKYCQFFVDSAVELARALGIQASPHTLGIVLPVGISFYTFQTMSYTLDVWRGRIRATRSLLDVATFVAFFPQLVAGPIVRASEFLPQLASPRTLARIDVRGALILFLVGFFKKACVADNLAPIVERYFAHPEAFDLVSAWSAIVAYAVQIYCDFSGYSDMAIACAALLGYRLVLNFDFPYLARDPSEFWRRWHISLSTWLRDYLYIPLGGNRGSSLFVARNLMLTMLLGGLWHGAAWTFVLWGGLHGIALVVHRAWRRMAETHPLRRLVRPVSMPLLVLFVVLAWVPFRAPDLATARTVGGTLLGVLPAGASPLGRELLLWIPVLLTTHLLAARGSLSPWWQRLPLPAFAASYATLWALALPLVPVGFTPFLYFQF